MKQIIVTTAFHWGGQDYHPVNVPFPKGGQPPRIAEIDDLGFKWAVGHGHARPAPSVAAPPPAPPPLTVAEPEPAEPAPTEEPSETPAPSGRRSRATGGTN